MDSLTAQKSDSSIVPHFCVEKKIILNKDLCCLNHFVQDAFQCFLNWLFQLFCLNTGTLCWQKTLNWCVQNCISSFCLSLNSCVPTDSCFIIFSYHSCVVFDKISGIWRKIMKQAPAILLQCSYFKLQKIWIL